MIKEKPTVLIDENSLDVSRYLGMLNVNIIKVGDPDAPDFGSSDEEVAKYAKNHNYIVITRDDNLVKQCRVFDVEVIETGIEDLAKKAIKILGNNEKKTDDLSKGVKLDH